MQVLINSTGVNLDSVHCTSSINEITRQFTFVDKSDTQNYKQGDIVEIYDNDNLLQIKAEIEYIEAVGGANKSEFIYAGRNNARYIIDCYAEKTIQFTENQKLSSVLSEVASDFGLTVTGDATLPTDEIKTILIGDKLGEAFIEITQSAGQIITSDAEGNLKLEFEAEDESDIVLEYGTNINSRTYKENTTEMYDKYVVVAQSNYLISQSQDSNVIGSYGDGTFKKVIISKHTLTQSECQKLAETEYKKDKRKSLEYSVAVDNVSLVLNTKYHIRDLAVGIEELMNLKSLEIEISKDKNEVRAFFERIVKSE